MAMLAKSALVLVLVVGCTQTPPPSEPATPPTEVAVDSPERTEVDDEPAERELPRESMQSDDGLYSCAPISSESKISINFQAGYAPADVAAWLLGWSCDTVVVPDSIRARTSSTGYQKTVSASELDGVLDELLASLDLRAISEDRVTVFVPDDKRLTDGKPGLVRIKDTKGETADRLKAMIAADIKRVGDNKYSITKTLLFEFLADPKRFGRSARLVPSIKNGKPNGFKLYAIRPSSVLAKLGFLNGDTVHSVNGEKLNSPDEMLEAYAKLKNDTSFKFEITRRAKPVTLEIEVVSD